MITALVLYDLPASIGREACQEHFLKIAPGFLAAPGFLRKQFIQEVDGQVAGGVYFWRTLEDAQRFYGGPWADGIRQRYGCEPRITYFETHAVADASTGLTGAPAPTSR